MSHQLSKTCASKPFDSSSMLFWWQKISHIVFLLSVVLYVGKCSVSFSLTTLNKSLMMSCRVISFSFKCFSIQQRYIFFLNHQNFCKLFLYNLYTFDFMSRLICFFNLDTKNPALQTGWVFCL